MGLGSNVCFYIHHHQRLASSKGDLGLTGAGVFVEADIVKSLVRIRGYTHRCQQIVQSKDITYRRSLKIDRPLCDNQAHALPNRIQVQPASHSQSYAYDVVTLEPSTSRRLCCVGLRKT